MFRDIGIYRIVGICGRDVLVLLLWYLKQSKNAIMKKLLILFNFLFFFFMSYGQIQNEYVGKTYIFNYFENIEQSNELGNKTFGPRLALQGSLFTIVRVLDKNFVIKFNNWKFIPKNYENIKRYNGELKENEIIQPIFFILDKEVFKKSCSEYKKNWDIDFGTFTTPFKLRTKPFIFTTDLNLGASISFRKRISQDFYWGAIGGLSLSSIKLDSLSTNGIVKTPSDRPAVTPSISGLVGYKNVNIIFGVGIDYISQTSIIENSWVYNKKPWFGFGIGISLFSRHTESSDVSVTVGQTK